MVYLKYPVLLLFLLPTIGRVFAEVCPPPQLDEHLNVAVPCATFNGIQYVAKLNFRDDGGVYNWTLDPSITTSTCEWNGSSCVSVTDNMNLTLSGLDIDGVKHTAILHYLPTNDGFLTWTYNKHYVSRVEGSRTSPNRGTLAPYTPPTVVDGGNTKTLLILYIVGSDLEGKDSAGTTDFNEMIAGYHQLTDSDQSRFDVIIAFGGANKDGWRGMKFATLAQIIADGEDGEYGNNRYLYQESRAHMGDKTSLRHFLNYVREGFQNYHRRLLVMWNHGGAYDGFGNDDNFEGNGLQLLEISDALKESNFGKVDMIGFDACLMAFVEVAKTVHPYAQYLLASEELEPGHGWNWSEVIRQTAKNVDMVTFGKALVDHFVKHESHPANERGDKTLSFTNLDEYTSTQTKLDALATLLTAKIQSQDTNVIDAFKQASTKVQIFGRLPREDGSSDPDDTGSGQDLSHFLMLLKKRVKDPAITQTIDEVESALKRMIIHAAHDGSRPNSLGLAINSLDKKPTKKRLISNPDETGNREDWTFKQVSDAVWTMQTAWQAYLAEDTTPPQLQDQHIVTVYEAGTLDAEIHTAMLQNSSYTALNAEEQKQIISDIKMELESLSDEEFTSALQEWVTGVEFTTESSARSRETVAYDIPAFFKGERGAFIQISANLRSESTAFKGLLATFADPNLSKVSTLFGNLLEVEEQQEDGSIKQIKTFSVVAQLPAEPTTTPGTYFTPQWNQQWYTMQFDATKPTEWLPLLYEGNFVENSKRYTRYVAEVDYIDSSRHYSGDDFMKDENGNKVEYAVLSLTVDESNNVVYHKVTPYKILYHGDEEDSESYVLFDKATRTLKPGDKLRLYELQIDLNSSGMFDQEQNQVWSPTTSALITLTQTPIFRVEELAFVDEKEHPLQYYYATQAEDASGNVTLTDLQATENQ